MGVEVAILLALVDERVDEKVGEVIAELALETGARAGLPIVRYAGEAREVLEESRGPESGVGVLWMVGSHTGAIGAT